jgi:hypothetical protein
VLLVLGEDEVAVASKPLAFNSAARLAARSSYPPQVGQ